MQKASLACKPRKKATNAQPQRVLFCSHKHTRIIKMLLEALVMEGIRFDYQPTYFLSSDGLVWTSLTHLGLEV